MTAMLASTVNETRKGLLILWDYKFSVLIQLAGIFLMGTGFMFFVGQGEITPAQATSTVLGFIITFYCMEILTNMSWALMNEAQSGTLEQMYMSPAPGQLIILGRSAASIISATIQLMIMLVVMVPVFGVSLIITLDALVIVLITLLSFVGFGFIMAGLTLIFKQIGPLANIVQNIIWVVNGTFLPISFMPAWMATVATFIPSTLGIIALRGVVTEGQVLGDLMADGSLFLLTGHSVLFFVAGWLIFSYCEMVARRQGTLGQY